MHSAESVNSHNNSVSVYINQPIRRLHFLGKLVHTIAILPFTTTAELACRIIKLISWDITKAGIRTLLGYRNTSLESAYLKTVIVARDLLLIPTTAQSAYRDLVAKSENFFDDLKSRDLGSFLSIDCTKKFDQFSSYLHGCKTFEVIQPNGIREFAAESDGSLNTVMASHFLKPDVLAINLGLPNVASFVTESREDGLVQTVKVDAKSLKREPMSYHSTNGKIQSGLFFVPTNLPKEALGRFKDAANKLQGRADITCVNTNCHVLKEAGFSIENREISEVIFPNTLMEHLLFRNVFYTDNAGKKHKVHFTIINTTKQTLEEHFEKMDMSVVGSRLRHRLRNADTEENRKARGEAAKALIAQEKSRLTLSHPANEYASDLKRRKILVSVPSFLGDLVSCIWGRHTLYELDLSGDKEEIVKAFQNQTKLSPFPQKNPSLVQRLKKNFFFSGPMIRFLRRHMMGHMDTLHLNTEDLFNHLKSVEGERLNYVLLNNKVVFAKVNANGARQEAHRKVADWALSKHALLAGRQEVYCSGEIWYDKVKQRFMINRNSGTYEPTEEHAKIVALLANKIFETEHFGNIFEAVEI